MTRLRNLAVDLVSRVPARVQTKLLVAFLAMVALLILLGGVGLRVLSGMNARTEELIELQRKIAAYRQVQHDTTRQLYGVSSALAVAGRAGARRRAAPAQPVRLRPRPAAVRRAGRGGAAGGRVRQDYDRFIEIVTEAVELARAGQVAEARELQLSEARPLADRLERLTNQLVNVAEADMLERIEASQQAYDTSRHGRRRPRRSAASFWRWASATCSRGRSWGRSPRSRGRLREVAAGEFSGRVEVVNRDELGALAADLNRTCDELRQAVRAAPALGEGAGDARRGQPRDQLDPGAAGRAARDRRPRRGPRRGRCRRLLRLRRGAPSISGSRPPTARPGRGRGDHAAANQSRRGRYRACRAAARRGPDPGHRSGGRLRPLRRHPQAAAIARCSPCRCCARTAWSAGWCSAARRRAPSPSETVESGPDARQPVGAGDRERRAVRGARTQGAASSRRPAGTSPSSSPT